MTEGSGIRQRAISATEFYAKCHWMLAGRAAFVRQCPGCAARTVYVTARRLQVLLKEAFHKHHTHFARQFKSRGSDHFELKVTFDAKKDEHLYGMGQYPNDCLDLKGTVLELAQKNTQISIPFLLSSKGYGFIWNNPAIGRAEFSMTHTSFYAEYARQIDYVIFPGDTPAQLVAHYSKLTGTAPEIPEFATGFWQSKLRYSSQEELLSVAREYKKRNLPISVIVADFYHWPTSGDTSELEPIVDAVLEANPGQVAAYRNGKEGLLGFFVGQVMKETQGRASPRVVSELVRSKLAG